MLTRSYQRDDRPTSDAFEESVQCELVRLSRNELVEGVGLSKACREWGNANHGLTGPPLPTAS